MKRIIIAALIFAQAHISADPTTGFILQDDLQNNPYNGITKRHTTRFYSDTALYTNGGLVFTYPTDYWSFFGNATVPRLLVSILLTSAASPTDTYSAVISASDTNSATIMVYRISNGGGVTEAASGEVSITILGIQDISLLI